MFYLGTGGQYTFDLVCYLAEAMLNEWHVCSFDVLYGCAYTNDSGYVY